MTARLWSNSCYSVIGLLALVNDTEPIALWNAQVARDFYPPRDGHNIYTTADPSHPFECIVFRKISKCINVEGNCRIILECDENCGLAAAVKFAEQVDAASGPARYNEPHQLPSTQMSTCVSEDQPLAPYDGYLEIQTHTLAGESCMFYAGNADCSLSFSPDVLEEGTWAVGLPGDSEKFASHEDVTCRMRPCTSFNNTSGAWEQFFKTLINTRQARSWLCEAADA
ncbi:hypothetical protein C8J57DRAFT_1213060 [Mycena rebaudengoi]|nr:hypothetical protein C8J57DRAFT_1213060 [Mycena rebaudengoi]